MNENQTKEEDLTCLVKQIKECHHLSEKKAQTFAAQVLALQKNLRLRKKQKQEKENQKKSSDNSGEK